LKINIVEKPSDDMLVPSELKQWLMIEKRIIEYQLSDRKHSASPVIGRTGGYNIPMPELEIINATHSTINAMLININIKEI
jgi:hypothetical protein